MSQILVVDDEAPLLEVMALALSSNGHQVMRAHNGEEALMLARTNRPDLVVSDFMMPRRNGVELMDAMRAEPELSKVPFILISAATPRERARATMFLRKPVKLEELEAAVRSALEHAPERTPVALPVPDAQSEEVRHAAELLNWVSHEIKTPLTAARLNAQLLGRRLTELGVTEELRYVRAIVQQMDRAAGLVGSILDAGQIAEGRMQIRKAPVDLASLLRGLADEWRATVPHAVIELQGAEDPLVVPLDEERIGQVLTNLLSNAVKYGGDPPLLRVALARSPSMALVEVRDNGRGIAASQLPHVFKRFHRAPGEVRTGHGLGLHIAAELTRLHGGTLTARSELGQGSAFTLRLPLNG